MSWSRPSRVSANALWILRGALALLFSIASFASAQDAVTPPVISQRVDAIYPEGALRERRGGRVELLVTIAEDGRVREAIVGGSVSPDLDEAARVAVLQWLFEPARRDGVAVAARIRVPVEFVLPEVEVVPTEPVETPTTSVTPQPAENEAESVIDVTVRGQRERRTESRSASEFRVDAAILRAAPRQEGAEVLRTAPGLYVGRGEGGATAHNYMLRGFDAEHGQDISFHVGGLPINLPSHIHGQGYADLGFLQSSAVRHLNVREGVYDPQQGDFAVAGSIDVDLGVEEPGVNARVGYGSFDTLHVDASYSAEQGENFVALSLGRSNGFGENRSSDQGSILFQHRLPLDHLSVRFVGFARAARANSAGVLRRDDVDAGLVCARCVYDFATARGQNALALRAMFGVFLEYEGQSGSSGELGIWAGHDVFRSAQNFTGFLRASRSLNGVSGRGDLMEQRNRTTSFGASGRYRTAPYRPTSGYHGTLEIGFDTRFDVSAQNQNLIDAAVRNQTWDRHVDAEISGFELALWGDIDATLTRYVSARLGFRSALLAYEVDDKLGNFAPSVRPQDSFIVGFRRSALGLTAGPRASIAVKPFAGFEIRAAYGQGYRSPQARQLEDGESAPFSIVHSTDLGVRYAREVNSGFSYDLSLAGYFTRLSDDVAFDAAEGRLERVGATQRLGAVLYGKARLWEIVNLAASVTYVHATLLEPPPATASEPNPPYVSGAALPFVPPVVARLDVGAGKEIATLWNWPVSLHGGVGLSALSSRPLPFGDVADGFAVLDASLTASIGKVELAFEAFNLFNATYYSLEYNFVSDWSVADGVTSRIPSRHGAAAAPLSWMLTLGVSL